MLAFVCSLSNFCVHKIIVYSTLYDTLRSGLHLRMKSTLSIRRLSLVDYVSTWASTIRVGLKNLSGGRNCFWLTDTIFRKPPLAIWITDILNKRKACGYERMACPIIQYSRRQLVYHTITLDMWASCRQLFKLAKWIFWRHLIQNVLIARSIQNSHQTCQTSFKSNTKPTQYCCQRLDISRQKDQPKGPSFLKHRSKSSCGWTKCGSTGANVLAKAFFPVRPWIWDRGR